MTLSKDEMMMAKQIVNSIIKDGIADIFLTADQITRKEIMLAYFDSEIKKFEKFQLKLMTNQEARKTFIESVLSIM